jgi:hypothetical protein
MKSDFIVFAAMVLTAMVFTAMASPLRVGQARLRYSADERLQIF